MRSFLKTWAIASAGALIALTLAAGCGSSTPTATPTHVVSVWVDGLNHADARQTCSTVRLPKGSTQADCQVYYAGFVGQLAFFGLFGSYRVVGHSVEQWREGATRVARVTVYSVQDRTNLLHVRLVETARGWLIASVS